MVSLAAEWFLNDNTDNIDNIFDEEIAHLPPSPPPASFTIDSIMNTR